MNNVTIANTESVVLSENLMCSRSTWKKILHEPTNLFFMLKILRYLDIIFKTNYARFYRNKTGYLAYINLNSNVLIMSSSVIENKIYQNAYYIGRSHMELNNTKFYSSKIKTLLVFAESQSHVFIDNLKLTNNHVTKAINICRKSKLKLYNADISRNKFSLTFLKLVSSSSALIQNNTITENLINAKIMKTSVMIFMIFQEDIFFTRIVKSS